MIPDKQEVGKWREDIRQFLDNECGMNDGNYVIYEWKIEELLNKIDDMQLECKRWIVAVEKMEKRVEAIKSMYNQRTQELETVIDKYEKLNEAIEETRAKLINNSQDAAYMILLNELSKIKGGE